MLEWQPVWLSVKVAASLIFVVILAYVMRTWDFTGKVVAEAVFSHDIEEARTMGTQVLFIEKGRQVDCGVDKRAVDCYNKRKYPLNWFCEAGKG